jgi:molybdopterin molybdotransferase
MGRCGATRALGTDAGAHFIGLPGNPVSSFITFAAAGAALFAALAGRARDCFEDHRSCRPISRWPKADKRREFLRVRRNAAGGLDLFTNQSSGVLTSVVWGDGVVDNPAGTTIAHGDMVSFIPFSELLA